MEDITFLSLDCSDSTTGVQCQGIMADLLAIFSQHLGNTFSFTMMEGKNKVGKESDGQLVAFRMPTPA